MLASGLGVTQFEGTRVVIVDPVGTHVKKLSIILATKFCMHTSELALPSIQVKAFGSSHFTHYVVSPRLVPKPSRQGVEQTP